MDEAVIRKALARLVNGVYVLTIDDGTEKNAMPVSWATQISLDPPLVALAVSPKRYTHDMIDNTGTFGLNALSLEQGGLVAQFKRGGEDKAKKLEGVNLEAGEEAGALLLADAPVSFECRVHSAFSPGDHTLFVAEIAGVKIRSDEAILDIETYGKHYTGKA